MKAEELRELTDAELASKLDEFKTDLFNLRFEHATGQLENYKQLQVVRRSIARVLTVQRERQLHAATEEK